MMLVIILPFCIFSATSGRDIPPPHHVARKPTPKRPRHVHQPGGEIDYGGWNAALAMAYANAEWSRHRPHMTVYAFPNGDRGILSYTDPNARTVVATTAKPIREPSWETPLKPVTFDKLTKASVEPVAVFPKATKDAGKEAGEEEESEANDEGYNAYEYEYFVHDRRCGTKFGHAEKKDGPGVKGVYKVLLPDGRIQIVRYFADHTGYHADITYGL